MPRKTKTTATADKAAQPQFSAELLEQLIPGPVTPAELEGISPMASPNSPTCGHPKFPRQDRLDYDDSVPMAMRAAASLSR